VYSQPTFSSSISIGHGVPALGMESGHPGIGLKHDHPVKTQMQMVLFA
jgi:hypothetical protein